jgi:hypothetical protein
MKKRGRAAHLISSVASTYNIHPQTLRLYEQRVAEAAIRRTRDSIPRKTWNV